MNIPRRLVEQLRVLREKVYGNGEVIMYPVEQYNELCHIIEEFEEWIIHHDTMFDHTQFRRGATRQQIENWYEYYDKVMHE